MIPELEYGVMPYIATLENDHQYLFERATGRYRFGEINPILWVKHLCITNRVAEPVSENWRISGTVKAYINHSRWLVDCPGRCGLAMPVSKDIPVFWCVRCRMKFNNGLAVRVLFPPAKAMKELETLLLMRPDISTRNWKYPEPVSQLARENREHFKDLIIDKTILSAIKEVS